MTTILTKEKITKFIAALFAAVFIYQAAFGFWEAHLTRGTFILFSLVLTFLVHPLKKENPNMITKTIDVILIIASLITVGYYMINFPDMARSSGMPLNTIQMIMALITVVLVLEASRRTIGLALMIITLIFLSYNFLGPYMPDVIAHRGYSLNRVLSVMYGSTDGIFGSVAYTFATFIFLFILFGAFIQASGAGMFFINLSKALVGRFVGGAAQAAVISSGLIGSIMGSSTANTAVTGSITIPLMINNGYKRHVAASVEAVVSIGGQFLPPIMGAAAFLMASFIGVPYIEIVRAGLIPALLFFISMASMVYLEAKRSGLKGLPKEEIPRVWDVVKSGWYFLIPIGVIVYFLMNGYSPSMAGFWAIVASFLVSILNKKEDRMGPKKVYDALAAGSKSGLTMATTAGVIGILIASISLPGLGMRFSSIILELAAGSLPIALALVMAASFVLGMGMNVTSAYLILATLSAPALVNMGVPLIAAHFFVFWTSQLAVVTPPVALSAYVAAAIAEADVWKTGWYSLRMGLSIYYLPILFVYIPPLLGIGTGIEIALASASALLAVLIFSVIMQGYLFINVSLIERLLLIVAAISLAMFGVYSDLLGLALAIVVIFLQLARKKKMNVVADG